MAIQKVQLVNEIYEWNAKRRYKINSVVKKGGNTYQNKTGVNTDPELSTDWVLIGRPIPSLAFSVFKPIRKGFGNTDEFNNEVGDIFEGWSNDGTTYYSSAIWSGGALNDSDNFTPLLSIEIQA